MSLSTEEAARAIHRVARCMHDSVCPACGYVGSASFAEISEPYRYVCPVCGFTITRSEMEAAIAQFQSFMVRALAIFEEWRQTLEETKAD